MKQPRKRLPRESIVGTIESPPTAKHFSLTTDGKIPFKFPAQYRTSVSEFMVRRTGSTNAVGKFLLERYNDRVLWTATHPILLCRADSRACHRKILVPVDFTERARIAAEFAVACFPYAQIVFLHAFHGPEDSLHEASRASGDICSQRLNSHEQIIAKLVHFTDQLQPFDNLVSHVAHFGPTFSVIANYAARMDADLILIAPQEQRGLKDILFGSAASRIANCTSADVLVVPRRMSKQGISPAAPNGTTRKPQRIMPALSSYKL
ncbi:universal stress protein [Herbaspirillum sp. GCM10030257]|uniref:universal stress protein n=1 Tax=Herbaspirillum sp. GCM10030257 TaxID=3273393 RepID=UPI00361D7AC3